MCPNWNHNTLTIFGKAEDVERFITENDGGDKDGEDIALTFEAVAPTPRDENGELVSGEDGYGPGNIPDWYKWRVNNWGCKWDAAWPWIETNNLDEDDGTRLVVYKFDTAWSPPEGWLREAAEKYPTISFSLEYNEPGMAFAGVAAYHKGECVEEAHWDYHEPTHVTDFDYVYGDG